MRVPALAAMAAALACAACSSAQTIVPEPGKITLRDALVSTVDALNAAYVEARQPENQVLGYYPCTVTATFNISATGVTDNKLGITAGGGPPGSGVAISANASHDDSLTGTRGNNVTVVFASSICAPSATAKAAGAPGAGPQAGAGGKGGKGGTPPATGTVLPAPERVFDVPVTIEQLKNLPK